MQFERLLADLSAQFVNLAAERVDAAIRNALRDIALQLGVDRCHIVQFPSDSEATVTHSWAVEGVPPVPLISLAARYPWAFQQERAGHSVMFSTVDELPPEASQDKRSFRAAGTKSHLGMPLIVAGRVEGLLSLGCVKHGRKWPGDLVARIRVLADVLANALAHKRARTALEAANAFEQAASELLARLLTATAAEQDAVIEAGLRQMAQTFGAERASLWQRSEDNEFVRTHRWLGEGAPPSPGSLGALGIPWIRSQVVQGSVVRFNNHAALPSEAVPDAVALGAHGVHAAVIVPLMQYGAVEGALAFATARTDQQWPEELVPRVRLVGEVVFSVLSQRAAQRRERDAQAQAAHAARIGSIGMVAASLVHELTQPLSASLANAETAAQLLAAPCVNLDELRTVVDDILMDERRATGLVQQLRRFLRKGEHERSEVDLHEVFRDVMRLAGGEAAAKGVKLTFDIADQLPSLLADRVQIQQVLVNLLLNGIDAVSRNVPDSRRVTVLARSTPSGTCIEVSDLGSGMDQQTMARAFEPFFTTKAGGMGLGLSISRTVVASHGGTLTIDSTPGLGTTCRVEFPRKSVTEVKAIVPPSADVRKQGTIFVVDDEPSMRRAVERRLLSAGYQVVSFPSAEAFLESGPVHESACLVCDIRMPGMNGLELQAAMSAAGREVPIVFMSGYGDVRTTVRALKAGAVSFLSKPFTKGELLDSVQEALRWSGRMSDLRKESAELQTRYRLLTPRERQVLGFVVAGTLNKVIADRLGTAETTVKIHRGRVMEKMSATSVPDLVRMSERLGVLAMTQVETH